MKPKFELLREEVNQMRQKAAQEKDAAAETKRSAVEGAKIYTDFAAYVREIMQDAKLNENK
jgi:hypothetical protein